LVQSDSTLVSGAVMLQMNAEEEMTGMVCSFKTIFGPALRHADTADSTASTAAQANPDTNRSSGV
jgi:hypothetical protein